MKSVKSLNKVLGMIMVCALATVSQAALVGGQNWADSVVSYTSAIQSYGGTLMTPATEFWPLGSSDADQTGNMHAWDFVGGDLDYVAGWRGGNVDQELVVGFNEPLQDIAGDDLVIRMYCGSKASATVYVSETNNNDWVQVGTIIGQSMQVPGKPGFLYDAAFDFDGLTSSDVSYVKVHRETTGSGTGMFFDSFASVPEPMTMILLGLGGICLRKKK